MTFRGAALLTLLAAAVFGLPGSAHAVEPSRYLDQVFGNPVVQRNLQYGEGFIEGGPPQPLTLDLYLPGGDRTQPPRPVLIYAHGGAYTKGNKESGHDWPYPDDFARRGFVSASMDYRLTGSEQDATDDMQAAVRWFKFKAADLNIDPDRIVVMGSSAGAAMAMSATFAPEDPGTSGHAEYPSDVGGGISLSGNASHVDTITPGDPPIAMMHSLDDTTIPYARAQQTCQLTQAQGNVCEMFTYQNGGHPPPFAIANRVQIVQQSSEFMCRQVLLPGACVPLDKVLPVTTDDVPAAYRESPVVVTLSATDSGGSGLHRTYYTKGSNPPEPTTSSAVYSPSAKPVLGDGERIKYFSTDKGGNVEAVRTSAAAKVDGALPSTGDDVPAGWRAGPVAVTLSASDSGSSGVEKTYYTKGANPPAPTTSSAVYSPSAKPVLGDGERVRYFSVDKAGNAEAVRTSPAAKVDAAAPSTADDVPESRCRRSPA